MSDPGFTPGFTEADYQEFRTILKALGERQGRFDANDATFAIVNARFAQRGPNTNLGNAGDIVRVLRAMQDLGYIRRTNPDTTGPHEWEYVGEEAGPLTP